MPVENLYPEDKQTSALIPKPYILKILSTLVIIKIFFLKVRDKDLIEPLDFEGYKYS